MRFWAHSKVLLFSGALLVLTGCGSSSSTSNTLEEPTSTTSTTLTTSNYDVSVVDESILGAKLTAVGCEGYKELGHGEYRLINCTQKPSIIIADGGFIDRNGDGQIDENDTSMGLPLTLDTRQLDENASLIITPLTTLATSAGTDELENLAQQLGLTKGELFSDLSQDQEKKVLLQLLNAQFILAQKHGVIDVPHFLQALKEQILSNQTAGSATERIQQAVEAIGQRDDLKNLFGGIGFNGFVTEATKISPQDIATFYQNEVIPADKTMFVGFIYDETLPDANITIFIDGQVAGTGQSDINGQFQIMIDTASLQEDKVVRLEAELPNYKNDHVRLVSLTTTNKLRELAKRRISPSDFIDLIISNVTTAEYVVAKKLHHGEEFNSTTELEEQLLKAQVNYPDTVKKTAALLKGIIDTSESVQEETLTYIENKIDSNINLTLLTNEEQIVNTYLPELDADPILTHQLTTFTYAETQTTLNTLASTNQAKFYTIDAYLNENGQLIKEYQRVTFTPTAFEYKDYLWSETNSSWLTNSVITASGSYDADGVFYVTDPSAEPEKIWLVSSITFHNDYLNKDYTLYSIAHTLYQPHQSAYYTSMFDGKYIKQFPLDTTITSWNELNTTIIQSGTSGYMVGDDRLIPTDPSWEHFTIDGKDFIRITHMNDCDNTLFALDFTNHRIYQKWEQDETCIGQVNYEFMIDSFDIALGFQLLSDQRVIDFLNKFQTDEEKKRQLREFINDIITTTTLKD
ncbi:MAG: hypothetical protein DSY46_03180 [Hydrogenimonas sp.]|nr:MAG: hypothetical protein DSY46_03180 [Hydrogenimonas sp.]